MAPEPLEPFSDATLAQCQAQLAAEGYVVLPGILSPSRRQALIEHITESMTPLVEPVEFEADVGYPGAPKSRQAPGGTTPRRLLQAYARSQQLRSLAAEPRVVQLLNVLLDGQVCLSQCHHNCVMTKYPGYSSATLWHQDVRYWSFQKPELISVWYALGDETQENGALQVIPGTHLMHVDASRLDSELFLRPDLAENQALIDAAQTVNLNAGDALAFHCRLFHAAGRNESDAVKLSPVFTYHRQDNLPLAQTRSDRLPSIEIGASER